MPRPFRYTVDRRVVNRIIVWLLKLGLAPRIYHLLTVQGRKTGRPHSVPVSLVEESQNRWLVAPYGEVDWVKNARTSGWVELSRGKTSSQWTIRELSPQEAAPVLKKYLKMYPITKPYFNAKAESSLDQFALEARSRPVFELINIRT